MWSRDWPGPKTRELRLVNLGDLYVLEITRFIFGNLDLSWIHLVLYEDSGDVSLFSRYLLFLSAPIPLQMIYVVIETIETNLSNPKLSGYSHSNKSKLVKHCNYRLFSISIPTFVNIIGCGKSRDHGAKFSKPKKIKGFLQILPPKR